MAITAVVYNSFKLKTANATINLDTDVLKVMLCTSAYTPDKDAHTVKADVTNELPTAGGYTAGGKVIAGLALSQDNALDAAKLVATDTAWTAATFTFRYAVIYDDTVAGDPLVAYVDFGADVSPAAGTVTIGWAGGILLTQS